MKRTLTLFLVVILIQSCRKDDRDGPCGLATSPPPPPFVAVNIIDADSNNLTFGTNPLYPFNLLHVSVVFSDTTYRNDTYISKYTPNGVDTVLRLGNSHGNYYIIHFPNGGGEDTVKFINTRNEKGVCFPIQFYDLYYNSHLILGDFSEPPNEAIFIIK